VVSKLPSDSSSVGFFIVLNLKNGLNTGLSAHCRKSFSFQSFQKFACFSNKFETKILKVVSYHHLSSTREKQPENRPENQSENESETTLKRVRNSLQNISVLEAHFIS